MVWGYEEEGKGDKEAVIGQDAIIHLGWVPQPMTWVAGYAVGMKNKAATHVPLRRNKGQQRYILREAESYNQSISVL